MHSIIWELPINTGALWLVITTGNRPTLPQYDNEGVIRYGLRSRDKNVSTSRLFLVVVLVLLRGHPSKTSGRKGVCVCANVDDLGRGGGHQPDVQKRNKIGVSGVRIGVGTPPPPRQRVSGSHYILRFEGFYARYGPDVRDGGGGCLSNRWCWTGGRVKNSVFARTSLMDDP